MERMYCDNIKYFNYFLGKETVNMNEIREMML